MHQEYHVAGWQLSFTRLRRSQRAMAATHRNNYRIRSGINPASYAVTSWSQNIVWNVPKVNYSFYLVLTTYMAILPRIIFDSACDINISHATNTNGNLTLSITVGNGLWWSNSVHGYYISPHLKYRKVSFPCPRFILRNMLTAFFHQHVLSSPLWNQQIYQPSTRHPPSAAI